MLTQLLKNKNVETVYCLVRGKNEENSKERLIETIKKYKKWEEVKQQVEDGERVQVINGDLSMKKLGIEISAYKKISEKVSAVYHCGAIVNHLLSYQYHRETNVLGTKRIISFCFSGIPKKLNYISSISVFHPKKNFDESFSCLDYPLSHISPHGGYVSSKIVCERIITSLPSLHFSIFRGIKHFLFDTFFFLTLYFF